MMSGSESMICYIYKYILNSDVLKSRDSCMYKFVSMQVQTSLCTCVLVIDTHVYVPRGDHEIDCCHFSPDHSR